MNTNVALIKQVIGWIGGGGGGNPGYGLGYKRVDPYVSMVEVANIAWDTPGDPAAPAGLGIDRNGGVPGGAGDDYVTRRVGVPFYEIVLTDTIPESGLYRDGTYNQSGTEISSLTNQNSPPAPLSIGRNLANIALFPVIAIHGNRCARFTSGSERPGYYGSQLREDATAALLSSDPLITIHMVIRPGTNFWPCDVPPPGHIARPGLSFYDDIMAATNGNQFDINSPSLTIDIQIIATQIVSSLALSAVGTYVMGEVGQLTIARYSRVGAKPGF